MSPRVGYEQIRPCAGGEVARTVEVRPDLFVDVDEHGWVLGIERVGDCVRARDLEDVIRALVYAGVEEGNER